MNQSSDISILCLQPSPVATLATPPTASPRAPSSTSTTWPNSSATPASAWRELPNPSAWPTASGAAPCPPAEVSLGFLRVPKPEIPGNHPGDVGDPRVNPVGLTLGIFSPRRVLRGVGVCWKWGKLKEIWDQTPLEQLFLQQSFVQSPLPFFPWDQHSGSLPKSPPCTPSLCIPLIQDLWPCWIVGYSLLEDGDPSLGSVIPSWMIYIPIWGWRSRLCCWLRTHRISFSSPFPQGIFPLPP